MILMMSSEDNFDFGLDKGTCVREREREREEEEVNESFFENFLVVSNLAVRIKTSDVLSGHSMLTCTI